MKITVIGDIHCRDIWKDIIKQESDSDKIVFLGDYTVPRDIILKDPTDACSTLFEILSLKDSDPDKYILLRGNHDCFSLGYYWSECYPEDHPKVLAYWRTEDVKNWFLKNTQWAYIIPKTNIVCSHAGISYQFFKAIQHEWYKDHDKTKTYELKDWIDILNQFPPSELFGFTPCKLSDRNGDSATQPCTWIRPYSLLYNGVKGMINVVGHTPIDNITNIKYFVTDFMKVRGLDLNELTDVWCCDCLKNRQYLVIENNEFKVCKICQ